MECPTLKDVLTGERVEECVEYFLFPPPPGVTPPEGQVDAQEELIKFNAAAQNIIGDYLWHNEPFGLKLPLASLSKFDEATSSQSDKGLVDGAGDSASEQRFFHGMTRFGDNAEDEWFVVHVLLELSKLFPGTVVRVIDNDGEFLLIEAADFLPVWAESDHSCRQRVYIYEGKVHLIPKAKDAKSVNSIRSPLPKGVPSIYQAVSAVRAHPDQTVANDGIQCSIRHRIGNYPEKMIRNWHHANIFLPPKLAVILKERPQLVAAAVLAFYFRDPIELKATRLMKNFKPGDGLVKTRTRFTKCLFAMLSKQDFRPDIRTGWAFPRPTSYDFKSHSLGAKLTTGFEILLSRAAKKRDSEASTTDEELAQSSGWLQYQEALKKTGYFRDYLEGSKPYQHLIVVAKDFYQNNLVQGQLDREDYISLELNNLVHSVQVDLDKLKEESASLPADDNESWMDVKPEDLDSLLEAQFQSSNLNPEEIPLKLKQFMKQISDFSGVEIPGSSQLAPPTGISSTATPRSNSSSPRTKTSNGNGTADESQLGDFGEPLDFKADDFVSAVDKLLNELGGSDKEWDASDDSYGSDEDDFDVNLEEIKKMHNFSKDSAIHELMQQMDAELATTEIGKSFNGSSAAPGASAPDTGLGDSKVSTASVEELDQFDEEEGLHPVNIDMNALANILESFQSQEGPSGPSANLLRSVGFDLSRMKK